MPRTSHSVGAIAILVLSSLAVGVGSAPETTQPTPAAATTGMAKAQHAQGAPSPAGNSSAGPSSGFAGKWVTEDGDLLLEVDGDRVSGLLASDPPGTVVGHVTGTRMRMQVMVGPDPVFRAEVVLAEDGQSFSGRWRFADGRPASPDGADAAYTGKRPGGAVFTGTWITTFGQMHIVQDGVKVKGTYALGGTSFVEGTADGNVLRFRYAEPGEVTGRGEFRLADDGASFTGRWREDGLGEGALDSTDAAWMGLRRTDAAAAGGDQWLVILEPHWESSLRDSEFSFGAMLREYYRRIPRLQVRHRRIHDKADFDRVGKEVASLGGEVILYVASHGTEAGAALADGPIDAQMMIRLLAGVQNVRLVHFGSCLVASGTVPEEILRGLPPERRVPISGFTRTADWGGSAIVDFAYLDNLIERQLPPAGAVAATRASVLFASDSAPGPVPPMDLRVLMPGDVAAEAKPEPVGSQ